MKKFIGIFALFLTAFFIFTPTKIVHAVNLSDSIVLHLTENHGEDTIDINVRLVSNTGISAMTLELVYDKNVFEFKGYDKGTALEGFDLMSTDLSEDSTLPVKFDWFNYSLENDFSTGNLLQLHFKLKPDSTSGEYEIGFKYDSGDIVYISNNNTNSKSAVISKAIVGIEKNKIAKAKIVEETEKRNNLPLILMISIIGVVAVSIIIVLVIIKIRNKQRKEKNWIKI